MYTFYVIGNMVFLYHQQVQPVLLLLSKWPSILGSLLVCAVILMLGSMWLLDIVSTQQYLLS